MPRLRTRAVHRPRARRSSLEASVLTPTLPAISAFAYPSTTRDLTPPETCSREIHFSMTLSERSILLPKTCLNWSRNPSTTRAAIACSASGRARRTVNCSASITTILPESQASAYKPPAHDLDRDQCEHAGKAENPGHVHEKPRRRTRGELPAHVDRVVERGEPGDLRDRRGEVIYGE